MKSERHLTGPRVSRLVIRELKAKWTRGRSGGRGCGKRRREGRKKGTGRGQILRSCPTQILLSEFPLSRICVDLGTSAFLTRNKEWNEV